MVAISTLAAENVTCSAVSAAVVMLAVLPVVVATTVLLSVKITAKANTNKALNLKLDKVGIRLCIKYSYIHFSTNKSARQSLQAASLWIDS
jgi:hypothetical protein